MELQELKDKEQALSQKAQKQTNKVMKMISIKHKKMTRMRT